MKALLVLAVAACGADTISVPITVPGRPALFMGRELGGAWHSFAGVADTKTTSYTIEIDRDFELAMVCTHSNRAAVTSELFGTYDDASITIASWKVPDCTEASTEPAPTVDVTGVLDTSGKIAIGDRNRYVITGEAFDLPVSPGLHDVLAHSNDYVVLIEHDVNLGDGQFLGQVPVSAQGTPMIAKTFSLAIEEGEQTPTITTSLITRNGTLFQWVNQPLDSAVFVPKEQLGTDDAETFEVSVASGAGERRARLSQFDQVPLDFALLPRVHPIGIYGDGTVAATWTPIDEFYTTVRLSAMAKATTGYGNEADVTVSKLWFERYPTSNNALLFDDQVPGLRSDWRVTPVTWELSVERWSPGEDVESLTQQIYPVGS